VPLSPEVPEVPEVPGTEAVQLEFPLLSDIK
jgi:hypothetical protein